MKIIYIITGVSRGLGYSLANEILSDTLSDNFVIGLSRSKSDLSEKFSTNFEWIKTDLTKLNKVDSLVDCIVEKFSPDTICFISNAGDVNPISYIGEHEFEEINNSLSLNVTSPLIIINHIISRYKSKKIALVNITSSSSNKAIEGWSLYSSSKSYMKMYFEVLAIEQLQNNNASISVLQIDPGAMDTVMQEEIRKTSIKSNQLKRLLEIHKNNMLSKPSDVAIKIYNQIASFL